MKKKRREYIAGTKVFVPTLTSIMGMTEEISTIYLNMVS